MKRVRVWISRDESNWSQHERVWLKKPDLLNAGLYWLKGKRARIGLNPGECREFWLVPVGKNVAKGKR